MGLLSWEEAESGTIPMGDLEGQRGFEESQRWTAPVAPGLDAPARERTWGDVWDANTLRIDQSVQGFQTELDASNLEYAEQVDAASRTPIMGTFGSRMRERFSNPVDLVNPLRVVENTTAAITDTVRAETAAALHSEQELENIRSAANESLNNNIRQMEEVSAALATIPNSEDMLDYRAAMAEGDYLRAAWNLPGATAQVLGEQAIPLLSAAAVTGTTYYFTRNPKATATAARVAAVGMSGMEYGSDLAQLWDEVPEDQRTYEKFKEVQQIARQSAGARALIETALPGFGAKIGNTAMRRATAELGLQMAAGGLGEDISNRIRSGTGEGLYSRLITGEGASAADIVLEAAADAAGVVVEAGPTLRNAAREDAQDAYAQSRIAQVNREFASELQAFRDMQAQAEANREVFDAEAAAEEAVRSLANREFFDNATQGELPIGSGFGGNTSERGLSDPVTGEPGPILVDDAGNPLPNPGRILRDGNDRVPTSVDMFSGESRPAQKVEERAQAGRAANNPRTGSLYGTERPENDVEFEERKQREEIARRQVADRKDRSEQEALEAQKAEEERARAQVAEDATVLKNEKTLLSSRDIRAEAERLLAIEQEGLRAQRRGIANTPAKMQSLLDAYGRKRLPELIDIVRRRRNKLVTDARKRDIARENEKLRRENAERAWREFAGAARPLSGGTPPHSMGVADEVRDMTGLLRLMPQPEPTQQGTLDLTTRSEQGDLFGGAVPEGTGYTGTLTDAQRAEEAAALAARRRSTLTERARRAEEESKKAEARKAEEEEALSKELEAEIGPIEQALNERATLTQKAYAKKEKAARKKIIDEYVNENPNVPRERAVREIARRVAAWKAENPPPAGLAAEASADPLVKQAQQVASRTETTKKQQETKATNKALEREIKRGATPEEAAEIVRNRRLSPEEDAAVRRGLRRGRLSNRTEPTTDTNSAAVPEGWGMVDNLPREQRYVKDALDKELASRNPKLSNVLRAIANNSKEAKGYRWLAAKLAPLVDNLGVKLAPWDLPDRKAGVFISSRNEVQINLPLPLTVLHEALHAVTVQLMTSNVGRRNPRVAAAVAQLDAVLAVVRRHMASNPGGAPSVMASATENTRELLAYGLTDGNVLSYLASIPMPGRGISNAWQGFKNAIAHIFNPRTSDQRTALDAVIEATGAIVEAQEQSPGLNEVARTERLRTSQRGDRNFADGEGGVALTDPEVGFTNPITTRSFRPITGVNWSLDRVEWTKFDPKKYNSIPRLAGTIVDWMTAGMGSSRRTTEILERAQTEAGAISGKAENLYRSIDTNLNRQARAANRDAKEYRDEFISKVTAFEEETAPRRKLALGRALRDTYGKAGRDYLRMRRSIDAMSRRILNNRLASDVPFTEGEAEIYQHIKANLGKYYTRIYASNTRKLADQRANRLLSAYRKVAAGAEDADLMDEYEIVRDAVEFMRDEFLYIPDREYLEGLTSARLKRLADAWGVKLRGVPDIDTPILTAEIKEQLIDALEAFVESTPRAREQQGMVVVERLLTDKSGSSLVNYFRGAREDRTIVTKREAVPPVIRKLLGEFDDPFISGMLTMVNQAQYIAHIKAINELMEVEYGERIMSNDDFVESGLSPQDWRQLTGDSYGPLEGTWVREDLADRIEDTVSISQSFTKALALAADQPTGLVSAALGFAGRQWIRLAGALKALQLVWNPANLMLNYLGGPVILLSNGNFNLKTVAKAHRTAWKLIQTARAEGRTDADVDEVIRAGITDSAIMGEIRGAELDQLRAVTLEAMQSPLERTAEGGRRRFRSFKRGWRETYAMADVVWKIANYYAEKEHLTALNKEEGTDLTAEQIEREAAVRTNLTNFSFKRVPNLIKALEKGGITYIFPYIYETFRAPVGSILLGLNDIRQAGNAATPEGKARMLRHGLMRTAGATAALGGVQALVYMAIKAMAGEDEDDEEWMEALKVLLPDYKQLGEYVYAGRDDQGRPVLIELSRADPMGPATELYKLMYRAATTEEVDAEDVAKQAWELVIANPYGSTIVKGLLGTASSNTRLESMDPTNYDRIVSSFSDPDTGMRVAKVLDAFIPSWYARALDPNNRAPDDQMILDVAGWMGMQLVKADPETSLKYAASSFALERSDVRADFLNFLQRGERSDEEIAREFLALQEREAEAFEELDNLFVGMLRLGYDQGYVLSELKARKVGEADLRLLASGTYGIENSGILSMASMEASWANAERQPTSQWSDAKKERYLDNLRRVVGLIEQGRLPARR